ncbi:sulfite exporter TauE/SafE family protein [Periweissella cryptocerci]|uniref:Probable membrane transporter protein n=1 Tax=Periweissella cryptocerci TaxID=2506420 RepID=A0A4V1AIM8_9LACO|nr:sulfite exporter TauE/SafE family protein [Periweissella cryptocerci]QBO36055.1 sulfite exporter TauE/SafE family protein [Periweissella cryptocerci]
MLEQTFIMLVVGVVAGFGGAILGLGGGIIVTPVLTLAFGLDIKYAIGASIIAVIATSSGATIAFLKDDVLNLRVAMFLEIFTTIGALTGAILSGFFNSTFLFFLFGLLLLFQSWNMYRKLKGSEKPLIKAQPDPTAEKLKLNSSFYDVASKQQVDYQVEKIPGGSLIMFGAGLASGLLGIGSGAFKVMAMDSMMKMPLKPSSATSNLMMGVTAAASATVYFFNGSINPMIAVPIALGILGGSTVGSRVMQHLHARTLRMIFVPVLFLIAIQMILKGFGVNV